MWSSRIHEKMELIASTEELQEDAKIENPAEERRRTDNRMTEGRTKGSYYSIG
jgi:hypothetical protein